MLKRAFDVVFSVAALTLFSPVMLAAAIGIKLGSPGPVIYRARRAGQGGTMFTMHKFRTMSVRAAETDGSDSVITAPQDTRIFPIGAVLRKLKIDELPQFWDVLRGTMSVVGPRPEDPLIVSNHYTPWMHETLAVKPGLSSPGSLFGSMHGDSLLDDADPETSYINCQLPIKLAVELVYVRRASLSYDMRVVWRTIALIVQKLAGRKEFAELPEMAEARKILNNSLQQATPAN